MESFTIALPADAGTPRLARRAVAERLGDLPRGDDLILCVSEVVTNAVLHAGSPKEMRVSIDGDVVLVEVTDGDPTPPTRREIDLTSSTGRGLHLLDGLTQRWGTRVTDDGKTVWFEFDASERPTAPVDEVDLTEVTTLPRRRRWGQLAAIGLVLTVGSTASALAWNQGRHEADRNDIDAAQQADALVDRTEALIGAGLAGIGALVRPDGTIGSGAFASYAGDVLSASTLADLAYEPVVPASGRAEFEASVAAAIVDRTAGGVTPAPERQTYYPVRFVAPVTRDTASLVGFDLAGDPVRRATAEAARDSGEVVFSQPIPVAPDGSMSFFLVRALYLPGASVGTVEERRAALVGFVSTTYPANGLSDVLTAALPRHTRFQVLDGDAVLGQSTRPPTAGVTTHVRVANRRWTVVADDPAPPGNGAVAWLLAAITLVIAAGLIATLRRSSRRDEEIARGARRAAELAALAQRLASATTIEEVAVTATTLGRLPIDAAATSVGVIEGHTLRVRHGATVPAEYRIQMLELDLDRALGFTESARTGATLLFETDQAYRDRYPDTDGPALGARAMLPLRRTDGAPIGAIAHLWRDRQVFDEALQSTLSTIADLVGQALERARLAQAQARDARHTEELARLAQGLASQTNSDAVMSFLTQGVLAPLDAMHAVVGVIEGRTIRRHSTPGTADVGAEEGSDTAPLDADTPLAHAARTGEAVYIPDVAMLRGRYPHLERAWQSVGFGATANVPLRDRTGTVIGALGVAWPDPVTFDGDLRDRLATVAGIAGQTLERSELVDRIRAQARRNAAMAELAGVLATSRTANEVARAVADLAAHAVDATRAMVGVGGSTTGPSLRIHHPTGTSDAIRSRTRLVDRDADHPFAEVTRAGRVLTFPDTASYLERYPHLREDLLATGARAAAVLALQDSTGERLGALGFVWDSPMDFDPPTLAALQNVADLCSQAFERAQLSDAEHRLVTTLQDSVLVPLPAAAGLAGAARYLPAAESVGMGGDWYEGVALPDGRYLTVVGDVAGHGITAVGQMAQLRSVIGALAALDTPLGELFPLASSVSPGHDLTLASAVVASIDPRTATVRYACAGHPPPLVRLPDGTVVRLEGGRQPLLGIPMEPSAPGEQAFPVGSVLVCYTDGLIERRGEIIDASVDRLAAIVATIDVDDPEGFADELLRRCIPDRDQTDDVALVVVRHTG